MGVFADSDKLISVFSDGIENAVHSKKPVVVRCSISAVIQIQGAAVRLKGVYLPAAGAHINRTVNIGYIPDSAAFLRQLNDVRGCGSCQAKQAGQHNTKE